MKAILYMRVLLVGFKGIFTRENIKTMLLGSLIGQVLGWTFVACLFLLAGCSKSETTTESRTIETVCSVPVELVAEAQDLEEQLSVVDNEIYELNRAMVRVKNPVALARLEANLDKKTAERSALNATLSEVRSEIDSYGCR